MRTSRKRTLASSKFFSKEINPKGMSIGNFMQNTRNIKESIKKTFKATPRRRIKRSK